jgi:protein O-GlcNAc transferase
MSMSNTTDAAQERFHAALTEYEAGHLAAAAEAARHLVEESPEFADAHNLLSVIAQDEGRLHDAEAAARAALAGDPGNPIYLNSLANSLRRLGRTDESIVAFEKARRGMPDQPDILFNLGNALRDAGRFEEAVDAYRASVTVRPGSIAVYNNLAITLKAMGDPEGAATILIEGLAFAPKSPELRFNLGNALHAAGRADAAEASYLRAVDLRPAHADAWVNLGVVQAEQGKISDAEASFRKAITLDPNLSQAYVGLADLADDGSLDAIAHRRAVLEMKPDLAAIHSSLLMCLHYTASTTVDELADEHRAFGAKFDRTDAPAFDKNHDFSADRPLRRGVISGDFRFHAMLFFAQPVLAHRDRTDVSLTCYSTTAHPDSHTVKFRQAADQWRDVRTLSDDDLSQLIVRDEIDVLIDLAGHAPHNRLLAFARRPAPLQIAWGDYVDTRGLQAIDVLIGDAVHTPMCPPSAPMGQIGVIA